MLHVKWWNTSILPHSTRWISSFSMLQLTDDNFLHFCRVAQSSEERIKLP
jgi:hypothetical protein